MHLLVLPKYSSYMFRLIYRANFRQVFTYTPTHYKIHTYAHPHITNAKHTHAHILQNQFKQPHHKTHTKQNSHNTIKYRQYNFTLMYMVLLSLRSSSQLTSFHFKTKSLHTNHVTSLHSTLLHFTSLHLFTLNPHMNSLACNYIRNPIFQCI